MASNEPDPISAIFWILLIFVGIPLLGSEWRRENDNKSNNTNKSLGEWMSDNKGETVTYFLFAPVMTFIIYMALRPKQSFWEK